MNGYEVRAGEREGVETLTLCSHDCKLEAAFAPGAGMLGCSLTHRGEELLDAQRGVGEYLRSGAAMGIPLLYPWANRLAGFDYSFGGRDVVLRGEPPLLQLDENGLPIHGLLAASPRWRVSDASSDGGGAWILAELAFASAPELLERFPFPHVLRLEARLEGETLTIATTVDANGGVDVPVAFGFHPYLRLPGAGRERWEVELPVRRRLLLDERMIPTGQSEAVGYPREPLGERTFDDGFADLDEPASFVVAAAGRSVSVTFGSGYPFAQVYSPPGAQFICFEPMTAPTNALREDGAALPVVNAGRSLRAVFAIRVECVESMAAHAR